MADSTQARCEYCTTVENELRVLKVRIDSAFEKCDKLLSVMIQEHYKVQREYYALKRKQQALDLAISSADQNDA